MTLSEELQKRYSHYVFWGHKTTGADFQYIYASWSATLKRLGASVSWVDDSPENAQYVRPGCWVKVMDTACKHLPIVEGVDYVTHNFIPPIDPARRLTIQVYTDEVVASREYERWGRMTYFDRAAHLLVQPWGTNLMPHEFMEPIRPAGSIIYWIGSVWNNELNQGNDEMIEKLIAYLHTCNYDFQVKRNVSNEENAWLVRQSRFAPAFAGNWQVEKGYLPCRVFKNISYGQLGITNVLRFRDILGSSFVEGSSIEELIENVIVMGTNQYKTLIRAQQDAIAGFDYATKMRHILQAFEEIR